MTDETKAREDEVTQADRDAAADWLFEDGLDWGYCGDVRHGRADHALVQAFARHRLAALSSATPADVVGAIFARLRDEDGTPYTQGFNNGLRAAEVEVRAALASIQPPPDVAQLQAEVERLREEIENLNSGFLRAHRRYKAAEAKLAEAVEALEDVINPLGYLRRKAETEGNRLGSTAYQIANDPATVRQIAKDALARIKETSNG